MQRRPKLMSVLALASVMLVGACGGSTAIEEETSETTVADGEGLAGGELAGSTTTAAETTTTAPPATEAESTTSLAPQTTEQAPSTTSAPLAVDGPADGVLHVQAEGTYSMLIGPEWTRDETSLPAQFDLWFTGVETPGFAENVNVLSEALPGAASLEAILAASEGQIGAQFESFVLERSEVIAGANHPELGVLEYTATSSGVDGRFMQVFGVWDDRLIVVTASTDASLGREGITRIEPYILSISPVR